MREIRIKSLDDLVMFVHQYNPPPQLIANIIEKRLKIFTPPNEFKTSRELIAQLLTLLAKHRPKDLPLFLTNPKNQPPTHAQQEQKNFDKIGRGPSRCL